MTECIGQELFLAESYELPEITDFFDNLGTIQNLLPEPIDSFLPDVEPLSEIVTQLSQPPPVQPPVGPPTNTSVPAPTSPVHPLLHKSLQYAAFSTPFTFTATCDMETPIVNSRKRPLSSQLVLTREELLKISSEKYDQIVQDVTNQRPLTIEEERLVKRQKRLIKNRESAQVSRDRKKGYISELEIKVANLVADNELLAQENKALKEENTELKNIIRTQLPNKIPEIKAEKVSFNDKKGLAVLAVFFFAFVFGFGPSYFPGFSETRLEHSATIPGGRVLNSLENFDNTQQVTDSSTSQTKAPAVNNVSIRSEMPADLNLLQKHLHRVHTDSKSSNVQPVSSNKKNEGSENRKNKVVIHADDDDATSEPSDRKKFLPSTTNHDRERVSDNSNGLVPVRQTYESQLSPSLKQAHFTTVGGRWTKPNMYMHCRKYELLSIPDLNLTSELEGPPQVFSLLLPASFLSTNATYQNYFVEINSQILGIFPLYLSNSTLASPLPK